MPRRGGREHSPLGALLGALRPAAGTIGLWRDRRRPGSRRGSSRTAGERGCWRPTAAGSERREICLRYHQGCRNAAAAEIHEGGGVCGDRERCCRDAPLPRCTRRLARRVLHGAGRREPDTARELRFNRAHPLGIRSSVFHSVLRQSAAASSGVPACRPSSLVAHVVRLPCAAASTQLGCIW